MGKNRKKPEDFVHLFSQDARLIGVAANHWLIDFKIAMCRHRRKRATTTVSLLIEGDDLRQAFGTFGKHLSELRRKVQLFDFTNQ